MIHVNYSRLRLITIFLTERETMYTQLLSNFSARSLSQTKSEPVTRQVHFGTVYQVDSKTYTDSTQAESAVTSRHPHEANNDMFTFYDIEGSSDYMVCTEKDAHSARQAQKAADADSARTNSKSLLPGTVIMSQAQNFADNLFAKLVAKAQSL